MAATIAMQTMAKGSSQGRAMLAAQLTGYRRPSTAGSTPEVAAVNFSRLTPLMVALATAATLVAIAPTRAGAIGQSLDTAPCARQAIFKHTSTGGQGWVRYCPLWRGTVPVYEEPAQSKVVGYLWNGGSSNWFGASYGSRRGGRIDVGGRWSTWWAYTQADNRRWGYVNEAYFAGNPNDCPDGRLAVKRPSSFIDLW
jgi:hypothetical protein